MIPFIYDILLFLMLFVLYSAGKGLKKNGGRMLSRPGIAAISAFTLNEGLRFGRDVDYNEYWRLYEEIANGISSNRDVVFVYFCRLLSSMGIPFQGFILLSCFLFIFGAIFFLRNFREILPITLPLFVLLPLLEVECLIRWFIGFSFILIGLHYLINYKKIKFLLFSFIGCLFHVGLLPIPFVFFIVFKFNRIPIPPVFSIPLYVAIGLLFQTEYMLVFTNTINMLGFISARAEGYAENAENWIAGGTGGSGISAFPNPLMMSLLFLLIWCGYRTIKQLDHRYVFCYNLFLFSFLFGPIANQIEIMQRYNILFFLFRSIVATCIIYEVFVYKNVKSSLLTLLCVFLIFANCSKFFLYPFVYNPKLYMYVWDHNGETYDQMLDIWQTHKDARKSAAKN